MTIMLYIKQFDVNLFSALRRIGGEEEEMNMKEKSAGFQLRRLNNQIKRCMDTSDVKKQLDSITGTNGWIICYLADHSEEDVFQRDLEKRFGITRSTASKVLSLMERKGLIERRSVAGDARLKKIVLTQKAVDLNEMLRRDARRFERQLTEGFTEEELRTLLSYLERMQNNLKSHEKN
jgi:DNA-binding MarR family transcriptional regulator